MTGKAKYEMLFPSPNTILFCISEIQEQFIVPYRWRGTDPYQQVDNEEYEAMKRLMKNESFVVGSPPNHDKICKYKGRHEELALKLPSHCCCIEEEDDGVIKL